MPTYLFECSSCLSRFEIEKKISERNPDRCESCGGKDVKQIIQAPSFHLKGSGWYKDGYSSKKEGGLIERTKKKLSD